MKKYFKTFKTEKEASQWMQMKNEACRKVNNYKDSFAVLDGPENNFVVVDLMTAIESNLSYKF